MGFGAVQIHIKPLQNGLLQHHSCYAKWCALIKVLCHTHVQTALVCS